jgi:hypothetical protein
VAAATSAPSRLAFPARQSTYERASRLCYKKSMTKSSYCLLGEVTVVLPEFSQAGVKCADGRTLVITKLTDGVDWRMLCAGQRLRMQVQGQSAPRVISAELVA